MAGLIHRAFPGREVGFEVSGEKFERAFYGRAGHGDKVAEALAFVEGENLAELFEDRLTALARLPDVLGVNCFAGSGTRWKTRMFAPGGGVPEDPATGSAAGPLACHLARHGRIAFGDEIEISQGAEIKRPSKLYARVEGSPEQISKVEVGGSAVIVARGEFKLD